MSLLLKHILWYFLLFVGALVFLTWLNVYLWEWCVEGRLYYASGLKLNVVGSEYLVPREWAAADYEVVEQLDLERSFKDPGRQMLQGWSKGKLLALWGAMATCSLIASLSVSCWLGPCSRKRSE